MAGKINSGFAWVEGEGEGFMRVYDVDAPEHVTFGIHEGEAYWSTWQRTDRRKTIQPNADVIDVPVFRWLGREVCLVESHAGHAGRIAARTLKDDEPWIECHCRAHKATGGGIDRKAPSSA